MTHSWPSDLKRTRQKTQHHDPIISDTSDFVCFHFQKNKCTAGCNTEVGRCISLDITVNQVHHHTITLRFAGNSAMSGCHHNQNITTVLVCGSRLCGNQVDAMKREPGKFTSTDMRFSPYTDSPGTRFLVTSASSLPRAMKTPACLCGSMTTVFPPRIPPKAETHVRGQCSRTCCVVPCTRRTHAQQVALSECVTNTHGRALTRKTHTHKHAHTSREVPQDLALSSGN